LAGIFGIATKDGDNDAFVQVKDGKVTFAPSSEAYKDYIKFMRTLYQEGLLWSEAFTSNASSFNAKLMSETPIVGMFTMNLPLQTEYVDDYIVIEPPKAEGYEPCWYYHPAINGSKNQFYVTDKCENMSVLMAWVDNFYNLENAILCDYGANGEGRVALENGKYTFTDLDEIESARLGRDNPTFSSLTGNAIRGITTSDYKNLITASRDDLIKANNYAIYEQYLNEELWPRPYYAAEVCNDADLYVTDINLTVSQRRGNWITGRTDIDADWDKFLSDLDRCGLQEYLVILQDAYDTYLAGAK
jgi:putative aldouronate transport system substrate-binding protein